MIEFDANVSPFTSLNECGDFYEYIELEEYSLLVVGDIGGHGSYNVYKIAQEISKLIHKNKHLSIKQLILTLHQSEILKSNGMTLFVAHILKHSPIISYAMIGNLKGYIYRKNNLKQLNSQDGIIGYDIPNTIKVNILKVLSDDIMLIATDGISFHSNSLVPHLKKLHNLQAITQYIIDEYSKDDDRLVVALKFSLLKDEYLTYEDNTIEHNNTHSAPLILEANTEKKQTCNIKKNKEKKTYDNRFNQHLRTHTPLELFNESKKLVSNLNKQQINHTLDKIASISHLSKSDIIKIKTFLHEAINHTYVDLLLDKNHLQIFVHNIKSIDNTIEFLFNNYYINEKNNCIINILLNLSVKIDDKKLEELKTMFHLGLDEKEFQIFQENEKHNEKISEQTRLAAMGEMIGNIAHQWRQPLSVISTAATGMEIKKEFGALSDEEFKEKCKIIDDNAQYLSKTIDDFRDFIKGDSQNIKFSSDDIIKKSLNIIQASIKDNFINLRIEQEYVETLGTLNMLIQAIINILNNAKDILKEKNIENKVIIFSIKPVKDTMEITITDNAGGIPENIKPKVFDAYFTTKHQSQGTGLGLNMTYNIITNNFNGTIKVENIHFNHKDIEYYGASFIINIPIKGK